MGSIKVGAENSVTQLLDFSTGERMLEISLLDIVDQVSESDQTIDDNCEEREATEKVAVPGHGVKSGSDRDDGMTENDDPCALSCKIPCPKDVGIDDVCGSEVGNDGDTETEEVDDEAHKPESGGDFVAHVDGGGSHDGEIGHGHLVGQIGWEGAAPGAIAIAIREVRLSDVSEVPIRHRAQVILCVWAMVVEKGEERIQGKG